MSTEKMVDLMKRRKKISSMKLEIARNSIERLSQERELAIRNINLIKHEYLKTNRDILKALEGTENRSAGVQLSFRRLSQCVRAFKKNKARISAVEGQIRSVRKEEQKASELLTHFSRKDRKWEKIREITAENKSSPDRIQLAETENLWGATRAIAGQ